MRAEQNELLTRVGPGSACGAVLRRYWQPVALVDEFSAALDPEMALRPVKAVRVLGQDLVLFRDGQGAWGLLDRGCPHRGADLSFGRHEGDSLRCPFHGWKFDVTGRCLETPAEPAGSRACERIRQRSYPVHERSGIVFAWLGDADSAAPPFPAFDCFVAPSSHTFKLFSNLPTHSRRPITWCCFEVLQSRRSCGRAITPLHVPSAVPGADCIAGGPRADRRVRPRLRRLLQPRQERRAPALGRSRGQERFRSPRILQPHLTQGAVHTVFGSANALKTAPI